MRTKENSSWAKRLGTQGVGHHYRPTTKISNQIYFGMSGYTPEPPSSEQKREVERSLMDRVLEKQKYLQTTLTSSLKNLSETQTRMKTDQSLSHQVRTEQSQLSLGKPEEKEHTAEPPTTLRATNRIIKIATGGSVPTLTRLTRKANETTDLLNMTTQMMFQNLSEVKRQKTYSYSLVGPQEQPTTTVQPTETQTHRDLRLRQIDVALMHKQHAKTPRADFFGTFASNANTEAVVRVRTSSQDGNQAPHTQSSGTLQPVDLLRKNRQDRTREIKLSLSLRSKEIVESMLTGRQLSKQSTLNQVILEDGNSGVSAAADWHAFSKKSVRESIIPFETGTNSSDRGANTFGKTGSRPDSHGTENFQPPNFKQIRRSKSKLSQISHGKSREGSIEGVSVGVTLLSKYPSISAINQQIAPFSEGPSWPGVPTSLRKIGTLKQKYQPRDGLEPLGQSYNQFYKTVSDPDALNEEDKGRLMRKMLSIMQQSFSAQEIACIEPEILERMLIQNSRGV